MVCIASAKGAVFINDKDALSPAFKDLAVGIFQLVPHTPVTAEGLNFLGHFKLASEDEYHWVGDVLAPKDIWKALYPDEWPGLADLTIQIQPWTRGEPLKTKDEKRISESHPTDQVRSIPVLQRSPRRERQRRG